MISTDGASITLIALARTPKGAKPVSSEKQKTKLVTGEAPREEFSVGESMSSCPRAGCRKSARPVR
jgi:hypothetical protein